MRALRPQPRWRRRRPRLSRPTTDRPPAAGGRRVPAESDISLEERARTLFAVNVDGVFNTIFPLLERFKDRRAGQIAVVSSLSGTAASASRFAVWRCVAKARDIGKVRDGRVRRMSDVGIMDRAHSPSYTGSKSAINAYLRSLRALLSAYDVRVNTICPGFVETAFTAASRRHKRSTPFLIQASEAARIIAKGLARNDAVIAFPTVMHAFVHALAGLPPTVRVAGAPQTRQGACRARRVTDLTLAAVPPTRHSFARARHSSRRT